MQAIPWQTSQVNSRKHNFEHNCTLDVNSLLRYAATLISSYHGQLEEEAAACRLGCHAALSIPHSDKKHH